MSNENDDYQRLLAGLSRGDVATADLPLEDEGFWFFLFNRAAHPGRSRRSSRSAAAAERLLHRPQNGKPVDARRRAAARALASSDASTRRQAIRFLHESDVEKDSLDAVSRAVHDSDPEVRVEAVRLLAKHASDKTLPALLDVLATTYDIRESLAAEALVELDAAAVPGLTSLLESEDARIRWRATRCLTKIAAAGAREALPGLLKAFHDDSPDVAWVAADGLLALGPDVEVDVLRSVLRERLTPVTSRALHHYAEHAGPARVFRPLAEATSGSAVGSSTLLAVEEALKALES